MDFKNTDGNKRLITCEKCNLTKPSPLVLIERKPGDYVLFEAQMDLVIAFSACPQDILPINGVNRAPTEAHYQI